MYYDKGKYESLIMNSPLFGIDKEQETTAYKRESYKMVEYLYCYLLAINERDYEPYGSEIMDVATRCINNFDSSKGVFLYYFNSAWKQEYSHIMGEKISDERFHGIRIRKQYSFDRCEIIRKELDIKDGQLLAYYQNQPEISDGQVVLICSCQMFVNDAKWGRIQTVLVPV